MDAKVVFYQLTAKLVDQEEDISQASADIIYYTLAVGHHTGVMDCFTPKLASPYDTYGRIVSLYPEGPARYKLEGIMRFGEIQIDQSHLPVLSPATERVLDGLYASRDSNPYAAEISWLNEFTLLLNAIKRDSAVYAMGRRLDG